MSTVFTRVEVEWILMDKKLKKVDHIFFNLNRYLMDLNRFFLHK